MQRIISILLENECGALSRVVGLFSAQGLNIQSLHVAQTEDISLSRITLMFIDQAGAVERITRQLNKLINVMRVINLSEIPNLTRELLIIKLRITGGPDTHQEIQQIVNKFHAKIIDYTNSAYVIELTNTSDKINAFVEAIHKDIISEIVRSGVVGIARSDPVLNLDRDSFISN